MCTLPNVPFTHFVLDTNESSTSSSPIDFTLIIAALAVIAHTPPAPPHSERDDVREEDGATGRQAGPGWLSVAYGDIGKGGSRRGTAAGGQGPDSGQV